MGWHMWIKTLVSLLKKPPRSPKVYYKSLEGSFYNALDYALTDEGLIVRKSDHKIIATLERAIIY